MTEKINLHQEWWVNPEWDSGIKIKNIPIRGRIKASVPGCIHTDLINANLIPDPFYGDNEQRLDWICETDWIYTTHFDCPPDIMDGQNTFLVCEGLDTIAEVFLNGKLLGKTENMFRCYQFPLGGKILKKKNKLKIHFSSPKKFGRKMEEKFGQKRVALASERVYLRKAQYSFGWDWGPAFPTMGIWKSVYLVKRNQMWINQIRFHSSNISEKKAEIFIELVFLL